MDGAPDTFPRLLLHHAKVRPLHPAAREKDLGIWQAWTWLQVAAEVRALACGLAASGFKRGMHLAIIGDNRPRLYWSMRRRRWAAFPYPCTRTHRPPTSSTS
jgi:long-chain acyl-CoA synthetase